MQAFCNLLAHISILFPLSSGGPVQNDARANDDASRRNAAGS